MARCSFESCKRKIQITAFPCKCKLVFCDTHKFYEDHKCSYNYFEEEQKKMKDTLSSITFRKNEFYQTI